MKVNKINVFITTLLLAFSSLVTFASSTAGNTIDDSVITAKVKSKLLADKMVSGLDIKVETNNGIVTLQGIVKTDSEATTAVELASSTPGVIDVDTSKLTIESSNQPLADSLITAKVKGVYVREKLFGDKSVNVTQIHVETKDGVVYLTGKANSATQAKNAEELAKSVKGVKDVKSSVTVEQL